jgi:hypothetical protein
MEAKMRADHPWVMKWMEVRRQRDLGITDDDIRMMRKNVGPNDEEDDDREAVDPDDEEDDDRQDDADAEEERDRINDMYVMRGYSVRRRFDGGDAGLRRVALHEAGHCVVAAAQGRRIESVTVVPGDDYAGKMSEVETPEMRKNLLDLLSGGRATAEVEARARDHVVGYVAGKISEWIFCPMESWQSDRNHTASSDLKLARLFARAICRTEVEAEALLTAARTEARDILEAHRRLVEAIADALIRHGTLDGAMIDEIIDGA